MDKDAQSYRWPRSAVKSIDFEHDRNLEIVGLHESVMSEQDRIRAGKMRTRGPRIIFICTDIVVQRSWFSLMFSCNWSKLLS